MLLVSDSLFYSKKLKYSNYLIVMNINYHVKLNRVDIKQLWTASCSCAG